MSNDLAVIEHVDGTSLEVYRDRKEVRELAQRLLSLHPAAADVGQAGMFAIAQLALLIGASPLPGVNEIHVWKAGGKVQFQLGVNYFRRMAQEEGGVLWQIKPRQMNDNERKEYGVFESQLAAVCRAVRAVDMEKYIEMGFTANQVFDMLSATGVAVAGQNESKHGRPPIWTALKRAEVDLYKQLFPTMMKRVTQAQIETPDVLIETEPNGGPDWGDEDEFDQHPEKTLEELNADLFGDPVEGEYEDADVDQEEEGDQTPEPQYSQAVLDMAAALEENNRPTFGSVASAAMAAQVGYNNDNHALNALAKHPDIIEAEVKVTAGKRVKKDKATRFYWYLIDRKMETVVSDEEE